MVKFELASGKFALVDASDVSRLSQHSWCAVRTFSATGEQIGWYAAAQIRGKKVYMHRLILGCAPGEQADHINHDGLNNCRSNLRKCSQSQNNANTRRRPTKSGFRGVHQHGSGWRANWGIGGKTINSTTFRDKISAAKEYDRGARVLYGEFATVNFP